MKNGLSQNGYGVPIPVDDFVFRFMLLSAMLTMLAWFASLVRCARLTNEFRVCIGEFEQIISSSEPSDTLYMKI